MIYGFTGTREGMSREQSAWFDREANLGEFGGVNHHGDCVGADAEFHYYAWRYGGKVIVHPPTDPKLRAFVNERPTDGDAVLWEEGFVMLEPKPYLNRNADIVDACVRLLACPKEMSPQERGGTWWTINYALDVGKPVIIIWPNGQVERA